MRRLRWLDGSFYVLGGRVPRVLGLLIGITLGASIVGVVGGRAGLPLVAAAAFVPGLVLGGQLWRLVTWVLFETEPVPLIFSALMLWWFGRDLLSAWGPLRFLAIYFGFAAMAAGAACLLALAWPALGETAYLGSWPIADALVIAWATLFPSRQILVYFVFPLGGRNLVYLTVGGTLLFALFYGPAPFVPHFAAELAMLVYVRDPALARLWLRLRLGWLKRSSRQPGGHLKAVERRARDEPPRWLH